MPEGDANQDAALARECDVVLARAGITVPEDRREGVLAGYRELRGIAAVLRQARPAESEPGTKFDIAAVLRTGEYHDAPD
ncbi:MAG: hypothetical protein NXI16_04115 [Alphaproteobacteria bacterium]|nr:hypothetical protein [Alphaproteobacteria bacterium]